jgi:uncharacterized protein (DUF2236 family)
LCKDGPVYSCKPHGSTGSCILAAMTFAIRLPASVQRRLDDSVQSLLSDQGRAVVDFTAPVNQEAMVPPNSVSWRIFKNPIALFVGGTAAVILELAEPAVRAGVWEHSSFRQNALGRLQRTGLAAMVTVYGARVVAESMIARIVQIHSSVRGTTPSGTRYCANDPNLLAWVHATAAYSFASAYSRYVARLDEAEFDRLFREGAPIARLYGAQDCPLSLAEMNALMDRMRLTLGPSPIIFEFLSIMRAAPALPHSLRWMQSMLVRAAVELVPDWLRARLGLSRAFGLRRHERWLTQLAGAATDRIILPSTPAVQSCVRLGLPVTYLYS